MDPHGAFASVLPEVTGATELAPVIDWVKLGSSNVFDDKMRTLLHIAPPKKGASRRPLIRACATHQGD